MIKKKEGSGHPDANELSPTLVNRIFSITDTGIKILNTWVCILQEIVDCYGCRDIVSRFKSAMHSQDGGRAMLMFARD